MQKNTFSEQFVTLSDGAKIHVVTSGHGEPALVPCVGSSPPFERTFGDELKKNIQFNFIEVRGTSRSSGDTSDVGSLDRIADDLDEVRKILGFEKVISLGQSRNGIMAAHYAAKYPESVLRLVTFGTPNSLDALKNDDYWEKYADDERRRLRTENEAAMEREEIFKFDTPDKLVRLFELESPIYFYDPNNSMADWFDVSLLSKTMEAVFESNEKWADFRFIETLKKLKVPALIAYGKYDFMVSPLPKPGEPIDGKAGLFRGIPGVQVEVFEKSGHFPYWEEEQAFAACYRDWVADLR